MRAAPWNRASLWWGLPAALAAAALVLVWLAPELATARPGGGSSYSGGGGSGGGGGGGGEAELIYFLIHLIIEWPEVGIPVTLLVIIAYVVKHVLSKRAGAQEWDSAPALAHAPPAPDLQRLRHLDPDFSSVTFEDFVFRLYAQAHQARSDALELAALAPYLTQGARELLARRHPASVPVSNVVIGAMKVIRLTMPQVPPGQAGAPGSVDLELRFESNMTAGGPGQQHTYYVVEDWSLSRAVDVRSRPPGAARDFPCPNCAAPFTSADRQRCDYCGEVVDTGRFDWLVRFVRLLRNEARPPQVAGSVPERGTTRPTVHSAALGMRWAELRAADPAVSDDSLARRLMLIHAELNAAWTALDLGTVRAYVSDGLFSYLQYWIDTYRTRGIRNVMEQARLLRWERVKLVRDRYFDALTVRLWATGLDYLVDEQTGKVVGGHKTRPREYSEYWTLIRGSAARGAARADRRCPNCGGELEISMAGACNFCEAHITSGEFDWVLSKIEQDESFTV